MANVSSSNGLEKRPKLRFPGFDEPWCSHKFSAVFSFLQNNTLSRAELDATGDVLDIHYGDVLIKYGSILDATDNTIPHIISGHESTNYDYLQDGDIIVADTAEDKTVGKTIELLNISGRKIEAGLHTVPCRPLFPFASMYLGYYMNTPHYHKQLIPLMQGIKVLSISKGNISKTEISSPQTIAEQEKISRFLYLLDQRAAAQSKIIDALKKYKRGLLHEILCEKIKVTKSVWNVHKIGDYLNSKNIKQLPTPDVPLMAFTATGGVCDKGERYDRGFLVKDASTKLYKRTDLNDFIYSSNNLDVGSIGLNLYGSAVISDVYEIFSISGADPWFISEAIQQKSVLHQILKYRQGCLYGQYRIYAEDFLAVSIRVPPLETQKQIGTIFSRIEYRIKSEQALLDNLERAKTFFLQQLFI